MIEAQLISIVLILGLAAAVATLSDRLRVPYLVALAILGAALSPVLSGRVPRLDHTLILFVLLPGLLFEAAFGLDWGRLRQNLVIVAILATLGVVLTTVLVGAVGYFALSLPLAAAALFGAAVAPTDPVAVVATFRRLGVPRRLANRLFWHIRGSGLNSI
jgi:CPA1 family monovalent cation:H+ antiporter